MKWITQLGHRGSATVPSSQGRSGFLSSWVMPVVAVLGLLAAATGQAGEGSFVAFESGQVRPMALSPNGKRLFVVNTPDNRLEIFNVTNSGLTPLGSVPVGMEPVSVAARTDNEVWVVNHLSDTVSIVSVAIPSKARVTRTLNVGDEPRDIVFAGTGNSRAFITAAQRNLNRPAGSKIGNADVYVFDTANLGAALGGTPLAVLNLFTDVPRALAVTPDGSRVYAAAFHSGNRTTVIQAAGVNGDLPPPLTNYAGEAAPPTSLIVKYNGTDWVDDSGRVRSDLVNISMPDLDVFTIDATAATPSVIETYTGVGTTLFNMAVHPTSGKVYVSNTEARNVNRFEGPGVFAGQTVRGRFVESRITVVDPVSKEILPRHLNKHINYDQYPGTFAENVRSLAFPLQMVFSADGGTLYVAALGSSKVGIFDTASLDADSFTPSAANHIQVTGGGPTGLVLDPARERMYVLTRFDNAVSVIDTAARQEIAHVAMYNPEPASITAGRRFLYDARYTSSRGDSACAGCHVFGDNDTLAWDLGNPDGDILANLNPFRFQEASVDIDFHPMKGPLTTQSFRGMANHGPMHWRGDRSGANDPLSGDAMDENAAFKSFNVAFEGLLGRTIPLTDVEMQAFADFVLQLRYPPNPIRSMDNSLTPAQQRGRDFYMTHPVTGNTPPEPSTCNDCHHLDPIAGFFGGDGLSSTRSMHPGSPVMKVPHLRNLYTKIGLPETPFPAFGEQPRGFFFNHDGSGLKLMMFLKSPQFDFPGGDDQRKDLIAFLQAYDSNLAPVLGKQTTLTAFNSTSVKPYIDTLMQRAAVGAPLPECDLVVKGVVASEMRGWLRLDGDLFRSDRAAEPLLTRAQLEQLAKVRGQELTFTCVPPGSGERIALDRDEDGFYDRDELDAGTDPKDPGSAPAARKSAAVDQRRSHKA